MERTHSSHIVSKYALTHTSTIHTHVTPTLLPYHTHQLYAHVSHASAHLHTDRQTGTHTQTDTQTYTHIHTHTYQCMQELVLHGGPQAPTGEGIGAQVDVACHWPRGRGGYQVVTGDGAQR